MGGTQPGDPEKFARLVVDVVRGEGIMLEGGGEDGTGNRGWDEERKGEMTGEGKVRPWPERLIVGTDAMVDVKATFKSWEQSMDEYGDLGRSTDMTKLDA